MSDPVKPTFSAPRASGIRRKRLIDVREFVRVWNTAGSVQEVADYFDISLGSASRRAGILRAAGVPLKTSVFRVNSHPEIVEELKRIASESEGVYRGGAGGDPK